MNIKSVRVSGLFDRFDHDLDFRTDERIMIVIGPNGFGKTTTLKLIDVLFNQSIRRLARMPFRRIEVSFDVGTTIVAERENGTEQDDERLPLRLIFDGDRGEKEPFYPHRAPLEPRELGFPISAIEKLIPILDRVGRREWRNTTTGEVLDLEDVLVTFQDELPEQPETPYAHLPQWLRDVRSTVAVRFIDTERLTHTTMERTRYAWGEQFRRTVHIYSKELAGLVSKSIAEYATLSQSLDRTFPARLVAGRNSWHGSMKALLEDLDAIKRKRSELEEAGLLISDEESIEIPDLNDVDKSQLDVLAVYAQDTKQKLGVFDDLYRRVNAFMRIANSRLRYKQVMVSTEGLGVISSAGATLDLEMLSSGEQHEIVILYDLIFRTSEDSLILIDEPELSMHVAWQEQFVNDLEEMAKLSDFRAILATHSPEIIGDRWDLTVELQGSNGE